MSEFLISVIIYCIIHSILSDPSIMKSLYFSWWYRMFYVVQSVVLLIPVYILYQKVPYEPFFEPDTALKNIVYIIWVSGAAFGLYAVRSYDNSSFLGITQFQAGMKGEKPVYSKPKLTRSGALSVVRHPYYTSALVLIWARPLGVKDFYLNLLLTAYFLLGTVNEERKLKKVFGSEYLEYMKEVPALVPFLRLRR